MNELNIPLVAGRDHEYLASDLKEGGGSICHVPSRMIRFLRNGLWKQIVRPIDKKVHTHDSVESWVYGQRWAGLDANLATIVGICKNNPTEGPEALRLLEQEFGAARFRELLENECGTVAMMKVAKPAQKHGGDRKSEKVDQVANGPLKRSGPNSVERLTARIKRDHPEIAARVEAGEFKSIRAAAIEAGIVRKADPVEAAKKALSKLTVEERLQVFRAFGL